MRGRRSGITEYQYVIVNDDFARAAEELRAIILAERRRSTRVEMGFWDLSRRGSAGSGREETGMAQVPIEDIMEHVDSKYRLVIVAAKRASSSTGAPVGLTQTRSVKPTYQALEEMATGKLGYEVENLAGEVAREVEPGAKPTWYRSLSAEEVVPDEAVAEAEEQFRGGPRWRPRSPAPPPRTCS